MTHDIARRKDEHLDLCATDEVKFQKQTTLLECVRFIHSSLPELSVDDLDTSVEFAGKVLRAPLFIASMTGGTERARDINRALAAIAESRGIGFGLGSQRAMLRDPAATETFRVRDVAPTTLVVGNLGIVQARDLDARAVEALVRDVGADALFLHMNPAQELIQPGGDRDFRGGLDTFARLARSLPVPVIAKETGCGISREVAQRLHSVGVRHVDVSGAGGTSWVGVETLRATGATRVLGQALWDWGIPTAASVGFASQSGLTTIATGGVASGLDVARAIALGARAAGIARPVFQALEAGGPERAGAFIDSVIAELRAVMMLTGSRVPADLERGHRVIVGELAAWLASTP